MSSRLRRPSLRSFLVWSLTLGLLFAGIVNLLNHREWLTKFTAISFGDLAHITLATVVFYLTAVWNLKLLVCLVGVVLGNKEALGLTFVSNMLNYLGPAKPGTMVKAVYLKLCRGIAFATFSAVMAASACITFLISGISAIAVLTARFLVEGTLPLELAVLAIAMAIIGFSPLVIRFSTTEKKGKIWATIDTAIRGFHRIMVQRRLLSIVCLSIIVHYISLGWLFWATYAALEHPVSWINAFVLGIFTGLTNVVTITPNNIGLQEIFIAYLGTAAGVDFQTGLAGAAVMRVVHIVVTFVLAPFFSVAILRDTHMRLRDILASNLK